jgi:membrane protein YdbS with pleckstrin-like domain
VTDVDPNVDGEQDDLGPSYAVTVIDSPGALSVRTPTVPVARGGYQLSLMPGEEVVIEGKPDRTRLQRYLMAVTTMAMTFLFPLAILAFPIVAAWVKRHQYWVTTRRVVVSNGIIGWKTRSVPFERISDVVISANWLERIVGLRSIVVRDMTGEAQSGAALMGAPDAVELQQEILARVAEANRRPDAPEHGLTSHGRPYRGAEGDARDEMLTLLRRIEANTRPSKSEE